MPGRGPKRKTKSTKGDPKNSNTAKVIQRNILGYYSPSPKSIKCRESCDVKERIGTELQRNDHVSDKPTELLKSEATATPVVATKSIGAKKLNGKLPKASKNGKISDFFLPTRTTQRRLKLQSKLEDQQRLNEKILAKCEDGLKVVELEDKGRGVIATKDFQRGDFIVEYAGELIETSKARQREKEYETDSSIGCYMYYFPFKSKRYCIDATAETGRLGRLINHSSKSSNCSTKLHPIDDTPYLILVATTSIKEGEELLYDYGDHSKSSIESHPWLAA